MSAFSDAKNYLDLIECCHQVLDRCHEVDNAMAHFGNPDARRSALADLQTYVAGLMFSLKAVIYRRNAKQVHAMFDSTGVDATRTRDDTQDFWRYGLTTITHFRVDALFQMLLKTRGEYKNKSAFTVMLKQLLDVCELRDRKRTESVFLVSTYLRNSFHNNGMHRGPNLDAELQDMRFQFVTGRATNCGSFGNVLGVLFEMMGCLEEMLLCPTLASLTGPILDDWRLEPSELA